jgi:hypothetical protein
MCYITHRRNVLFYVLGLCKLDTFLERKVCICEFISNSKDSPLKISLLLFHEWDLELNACQCEMKPNET